MSIRRFTIFLLILLGMLNPLWMNVSSAQGLSESESTGSWQQYLKKMYAGIGLGYSFLEAGISSSSHSIRSNNDTGSALVIGMDVNDHFAVELNLTDYGASSLKPDGEIQHDSIAINALFYMFTEDAPYHHGFSGIFKVGLENHDNQSSVAGVSSGDLSLVIGIGLEYAFDNGFAVQGRINTLHDDANMLGAYLIYRFDYDPPVVVAGSSAVVESVESKDKDNDGVPNEQDLCPDTKPGRLVDAQGCEGDDDLDGVLNGEDLCPDTEEGVRVNIRGCSFDTDNDGVADEIDECPTTPSRTQVDSVGCELDSDEDGVTDSQDMCPSTPAGDRVDDRGCTPDDDGDGVGNNRDQCADTPIGFPVDAMGCALDLDRDGVADSLDKCPDTIIGATVNAEGCARFEGAIEGITFARGSADLTESAKEQINVAIVALARFPSVRIEIQAHTDSRGSIENNQKLSEQRAESVLDYMESQGISRERLTASGFGESRPLTSNATAEGRALNRRVEFHVVDRGQGSAISMLAPMMLCTDANTDNCFDLGIKTEGISFRLASAELTETTKVLLDKAALALLENPQVRLSIEAHTDSQGREDNNQKLSEARANSVRDYLISRGVDADRLEARGFGESKPLESNRTAEGRARNRRVEFLLLTPPAQ